MKTIPELEQEIKELQIQIEPLEDRVTVCKQTILALKSKFKVGDVITWAKGKRKGKVQHIRDWVCGEPMWIVLNILKDGSFGTTSRVRNYDDPKLYHE